MVPGADTDAGTAGTGTAGADADDTGSGKAGSGVDASTSMPRARVAQPVPASTRPRERPVTARSACRLGASTCGAPACGARQGATGDGCDVERRGVRTEGEVSVPLADVSPGCAVCAPARRWSRASRGTSATPSRPGAESFRPRNTPSSTEGRCRGDDGDRSVLGSDIADGSLSGADRRDVVPGRDGEMSGGDARIIASCAWFSAGVVGGDGASAAAAETTRAAGTTGSGDAVPCERIGDDLSVGPGLGSKAVDSRTFAHTAKPCARIASSSSRSLTGHLPRLTLLPRQGSGCDEPGSGRGSRALSSRTY